MFYLHGAAGCDRLLPFAPQVHDFLSRFDKIPDMLELDHLTVSGDVTFGKNVSLKVQSHFLQFLLQRSRMY